MATATLDYATIQYGGATAKLEIDYDDTSNPADWTLIRGRVVNGLDRPVYVLWRRGGGQPFFEREVAAGATVEVNAGGPVRTESDIPFWMFVTR